MYSLAEAVGKSQSNRPVDVATIQELLWLLPIEAGGAPTDFVVDGICKDKTIAAIQHFQRVQFQVSDGVVQPNDFTIKRLSILFSRHFPEVSPIDIKLTALKSSEWRQADLGQPLETRPCGDGIGAVGGWQEAPIFYHPELGAFEVHGEIGIKYLEMGAEASPLGYPISDERSLPDGGRVSYFQYGSITWGPSAGVAVFNAPGM
jgi:hypothetical protein